MSRRVLNRAASVLITIVFGISGTSTAASAEPGHRKYGSTTYEDPIKYLVSDANTDPAATKCVGLADRGSTANGTALVLWDCHFHLDQFWYFRDDDQTFRSYATGYPAGKCVGLADKGSTANGTSLVLWDCHGTADQRWRRADRGDGRVNLINTASGRCVSLANRGSTVNGTLLVLWDCHGTADQRWILGVTPP